MCRGWRGRKNKIGLRAQLTIRVYASATLAGSNHERDWTQRKINADLAEQEGWVPSDDIDPALLLASQGGFDRVLMNHVQCVNAQDSLEQRAGVVRSALASYTRPSEFTWLIASNGVARRLPHVRYFYSHELHSFTRSTPHRTLPSPL